MDLFDVIAPIAARQHDLFSADHGSRASACTAASRSSSSTDRQITDAVAGTLTRLNRREQHR
jgi:hypothetical protein